MRHQPTEFGKWIRELRQSKNMKQLTLAKLLGFKFSQSIANIEAGRAPFPVVYIPRFCEVMGVDMNEFVNKLLLNHAKNLMEEIEKAKASKKAYLGPHNHGKKHA